MEWTSAILSCEPPRDENGQLHFEVGAPRPAVSITAKTTIPELASGPRVFLPFHLMEINWEFLKSDPDKWESSDDYQKLDQYANRIRVTNDLAERGVQLFSQYHGKVTKDEEDRQRLMSTVIRQRRTHSKLTRSALTEMHNRKLSK